MTHQWTLPLYSSTRVEDVCKLPPSLSEEFNEESVAGEPSGGHTEEDQEEKERVGG